jgi:hypothetical protein
MLCLAYAATRCGDLKTCIECHESPGCGWCDDGSATGLGTCMDGGMTGPTGASLDSNGTSTCPDDRWYFALCPGGSHRQRSWISLLTVDDTTKVPLLLNTSSLFCLIRTGVSLVTVRMTCMPGQDFLESSLKICC